MTRLIQALKKEIHQHNLQCWLAALSCLFLAWLAWLALTALLYGFALLIKTVKDGPDSPHPAWLPYLILALIAFLLIWASWDAFANRFRPVPERPIIGWHLLADILLLPPRLTFGIWQNLSATIHLQRPALEVAANFILQLSETGRLPLHSTAVEIPHPKSIEKIIDALKILRWVDLHKNQDGWFYSLVSDRQKILSKLTEKN